MPFAVYAITDKGEEALRKVKESEYLWFMDEKFYLLNYFDEVPFSDTLDAINSLGKTSLQRSFKAFKALIDLEYIEIV